MATGSLIRRAWPALLAVSIALYGCGGGGGSSSENDPPTSEPPADDSDPTQDQPPASTDVSGTAAAGAALAGFVAVKDSQGEVLTADIGPGGAFSIDTEGLTPPFLMYASGLAGGQAFTLYSAGTSEDIGGTVNITPLTDLVLANLVGADAEEFFNSPDFSLIDKGALSDQAAALKARLQPVLEAIDAADDLDLLNGAFTADHTGMDAVLDLLDVTVDPATDQAIITNRLDPDQQITDDLTSQADGDTLAIGSVTDPVAAVDDLQSLAQTLGELSSLVASGAPTEAEVSPYLHDALRHNGFSRADVVALFTSSDSEDREDAQELAAALADFGLVSLETSSTPKSAVLEYGDSTYMEIRNAGAGWQIYGNQQLWGAWVETETYQTGESLKSGILFDAEGSVFEPGDYMIVQGKGVAEEGLRLVQYEFNDPQNEPTPGEFSSEGAEAVLPSDEVIATMSAREGYTFIRMSDPNGDSDPALETTLADDVEQERYVARLRMKPLPSTASAEFPEVTAPTVSELESFGGGDLTMSWSLPTGYQADEASLFVTYQDGTEERFDVELAPDATSADFTGVTLSGSVSSMTAFLFSQDQFDRTFGTGIGF